MVPSRLDTAQLKADVEKSNGRLDLKTVEGADLTVTDRDGKLFLTGA